jgi:ribosomal protein S18 acetylase RimI-like enzyme
MLMDAAKVLARRLHSSRVILSVFEGNTAAEKLYRKAGFVECGKVPGWLQDGYVNETYMVLNLD